MVYIYIDWGKFILMKWLTVFWLLANLKTTGQPRRLATQGRVDMAARVQSHLEAESLLPWRIQCFSFKAFSWLDEIQPHYGRSSCFTTFFFFLFQVGYVPSGQSRCLNMTPSLFGPFLDSFVPHQEQQTACSMMCARPHSDLIFSVVSVAVITVLNASWS